MVYFSIVQKKVIHFSKSTMTVLTKDLDPTKHVFVSRKIGKNKNYFLSPEEGKYGRVKVQFNGGGWCNKSFGVEVTNFGKTKVTLSFNSEDEAAKIHELKEYLIDIGYNRKWFGEDVTRETIVGNMHGLIKIGKNRVEGGKYNDSIYANVDDNTVIEDSEGKSINPEDLAGRKWGKCVLMLKLIYFKGKNWGVSKVWKRITLAKVESRQEERGSDYVEEICLEDGDKEPTKRRAEEDDKEQQPTKKRKLNV